MISLHVFQMSEAGRGIGPPTKNSSIVDDDVFSSV